MKTFQPMQSSVYLTDNGRALCGAHLGASASITGRDISGQPIHKVTLADVEYCRSEGFPEMTCETCGQRPEVGK